MTELRAVDLERVMEALRQAPRPVSILWQEGDSLAFVARGRPHRSEFHIDPSDEVMHVLKGEMELHYLTSEGERQVVLVPEGGVIHCPAGTPHSPHFSGDSFLLVLERKRGPGEVDRFIWYCEKCNAPVYETSRHVADYRDDPVSDVYVEFYDDVAHRTCPKCGHVDSKPAP